MTINADGSHAVQPHTANAHTAPARPVRHAVVEEEVLEPLRPVEGWGFANRVMIVSTVLTMAFVLGRLLLFPEAGQVPVRDIYIDADQYAVAMGETGRGWVASIQSMLFGLVGGALAAAAGYLIVILMGGAARSAARYAIGGLIGGILAAVGILFVFSNTVALSLGAHVFWILPLAGLLGGLWAGITSARR
ncbi:hypothetical protein [Micrococcus endophyticus]|uniref:hypothetical protein n=1 Tax=Micrococcus endophyticus TaxID=455343 RepID=UPI0020044DE9|nr:hypothetical protein [Micrococcus endophyticus]MCK6091331.1 hypothetical protein [Micrococcus endophyticus]